MKQAARVLVAPIRVYQRFVSPMLGARCRYHPSCSEYMAQALVRHGIGRGIYLGVRRLLSCHPWSPGGFDEVPDDFTWRPRAHQHMEAA
jgi:uncharacterized protein